MILKNKINYLLIISAKFCEVFCLCEVCVVHDATATEVTHDVIPGDGHGVLVIADRVVLSQGVCQEVLSWLVNVAFLEHDSQDNNCNLNRKKD